MICSAVLPLYDVVYFQPCLRIAFMMAMLTLVSVPPPDIFLDVFESVLRSPLVSDALDIRILDFINYPRGRAPGFVTVHRYWRPDTASRL